MSAMGPCTPRVLGKCTHLIQPVLAQPLMPDLGQASTDLSKAAPQTGKPASLHTSVEPLMLTKGLKQRPLVGQVNFYIRGSRAFHRHERLYL